MKAVAVGMVLVGLVLGFIGHFSATQRLRSLRDIPILRRGDYLGSDGAAHCFKSEPWYVPPGAAWAKVTGGLLFFAGLIMVFHYF